jgi:hypothetical protein
MVHALPKQTVGCFELHAFFTFSQAERELIGARRGESLKLGLALQIGFLRTNGCVVKDGRLGASPPCPRLLRLLHLQIPLHVGEGNRRGSKLSAAQDKFCSGALGGKP